MESFWETIKQTVSANPELLGILFALVGLLIFVGAILRWEWVIGSSTSGNRIRTDVFGMIIYKLFGRRVFFILTGLVIMLAGAAWFIFMGML